MKPDDHKLNLITAYKSTRHDGTDFRTGRVLYKPGQWLEVANAAPPDAGCCKPGLHVSPSPRATCRYIDGSTRGSRARFFECLIPEGDLLSVDNDKLRVRRLYVLREVPFEEIFGADLLARIAAVRDVIAAWKTIPWLKPSRVVTDAELLALFERWHDAITPWLRPGTEAPRSMRVVRNRAADAAADDAAADAAADDDAAAAADAAADDAAAAADAAADDDAAADAAAADDAAAAAAAAAAALYRLLPYWVRWYVRPRYVLWRMARWQIAAMPGASPWEPLVEMYRLGCAPLGYCRGRSGPEFVIYAPSPEASNG